MTSPAQLALDANILVLLVAGLTDESIIPRHKRLKKYDPEDFNLLMRILLRYKTLIVTPGVLAECSDLLRYDPASKDRTCTTLHRMLTDSDALLEIYHPTKEAALMRESTWLGLVDAGLLKIVDDGIPLITDDFALFAQACRRNNECINFDATRLN